MRRKIKAAKLFVGLMAAPEMKMRGDVRQAAGLPRVSNKGRSIEAHDKPAACRTFQDSAQREQGPSLRALCGLCGEFFYFNSDGLDLEK
jgi:hypothetical protein